MSLRGAALRRFAVLGGLGAAMLARPRDVVRTMCGDAPMPPVVLVRVLGARQLVQELVVLAAPSRRVLVGAAATDVMHAVSMVAAALVWPEYRRPALTSASVATGSAGSAAAAAPSR